MAKFENNETKRKDIFAIDPRNIVVQEGFNSRVNFCEEDLMPSIKEKGVLNPVTVIRIEDENGNEKYRLVDGERRFRACMKLINTGQANIYRIPAIILPQNTSEIEMLSQQIIRNTGKKFNWYELGIACKKFLAYGLERKEIAKEIGCDSAMVTIYLEVLDYPKELRELISKEEISGSEARCRVLRAYKDKDGKIDTETLMKELAQAKENARKNNRKTITSSDFDIDSKTKTFKTSQNILKGLRSLYEYYAKRTDNGRIQIKFDWVDMLEDLNEGEGIDVIFDRLLEEAAGGKTA